MNNNTTKFLILVMLALVAYFGYTRYRERIKQFIPSSIIPGMKANIIYDSDPQNDRFIKGNMNPKQFAVLDNILNEEERKGGMRVSSGKVRDLAKEDKGVIEAYDRWWRCANLMRSENHVIYPSERK